MTEERSEITKSLSKLDKIIHSLEINPLVIWYQNRRDIIPPHYGFLEEVQIYAAPKTPLINTVRLNKFTHRLIESDIKPTGHLGALIQGQIFRPPEIEFAEDIVMLEVVQKTTTRILDKTLNIAPNAFDEENLHTTTLQRKIMIKVFPHQRLARLAYIYDTEKLDKKNLKNLIHFPPLMVLHNLLDGQDPFIHFDIPELP
jgi:hypothetical protein